MEEEAIIITPALLAAFGRWLLNDIGVELDADYGIPPADQRSWIERRSEHYYSQLAGEAWRWNAYAAAWSTRVNGGALNAPLSGRGLHIVEANV